jgi:predicted PhzF superfamily epimerase YddE/YHI9
MAGWERFGRGMSRVPFYLVDAFTDVPGKGNPAGVCICGGDPDAAWAQLVAKEVNQPETAFVWGEGERWNIRWFSPQTEVALCGHATLASAKVLFEERRVEASSIEFTTRESGVLHAARGTASGSYSLKFPRRDPAEVPPPDVLVKGLGVDLAWCGFAVEDYFVEVRDAAVLRNISPRFSELLKLDGRGVIVTARGEGGYDFVSRFFCPRIGVNEDPVTGSAHCALAPYWAAKLRKEAMRGFQASPRGGVVEVVLGKDFVTLGGRAVVSLRGEVLFGY